MPEPDPFIAALRALAAREGGYRVVAERAGLSAPNLWQILSGVKLPSGNPRGVGPAIRKALTSAYPDWLSASPELRSRAIASRGRQTSRSRLESARPGGDAVPLISWVQAGAWTTASDPGEPEEWLPCIRPHSASTYALRVQGDSMTAPHGNGRSYPEGCFIFVDPERNAPANGDRVVARLEGSNKVTFKVFKSEDGRRWLAPLNPSHEPIREPFRVLGTIIGKWEDG